MAIEHMFLTSAWAPGQGTGQVKRRKFRSLGPNRWKGPAPLLWLVPPGLLPLPVLLPRHSLPLTVPVTSSQGSRPAVTTWLHRNILDMSSLYIFAVFTLIKL
ncbi:hypothetical protein A6R68_18919 [Neotoma lepida]|uniref:Uncharacterized protein n=1 Tax=Neotoma lepida TaxID=56216 RepID=A0A1A6HK71_NEOLE|nr:hypothetical protein A6R68_18919 [Neotoma lepida]